MVKPLKNLIEQAIDQWKASSDHEFTPAGNARPPKNDDMSAWLSAAWNSLDSAMIANSFERCFLGDSLFLHIAQHELYGSLFRQTMARLTGEQMLPEIHQYESEESGISEVDDE